MKHLLVILLFASINQACKNTKKSESSNWMMKDTICIDCHHIPKFDTLGHRLHEPSDMVFCTWPSQRHCVWCGVCLREDAFMPEYYQNQRHIFFIADGDTMYMNGAFQYLDSMEKLKVDIWKIVFDSLNKNDTACISRSLNKTCSRPDTTN